MSSDEPAGAPADRDDERRGSTPDAPWVAPSARPGASDETPTAPEPLPIVPAGAGPVPPAAPPSGSAGPADYPPPVGPPLAASVPAPPPPPAPAPPLAPGQGAAGPVGAVAEAPRRGNPVGVVAFVVAIVALVLAVLPFVTFVAGLPALAAIVLGIIGLVLAGRRRGFAAAGLILGAVALVVALAVSTITVVGFVRDKVTDLPQVSDFPSDFPSDLPSGVPSDGSSSGTGLAAGPHTIVYRITGGGKATITYSTIANGRSATARDTQVVLPHERTQHLTVTTDGMQQFLLAAITLDGSGKLRCSIEVDGTVIASSASSASSGVELVTCDGREGGF